MGEWSDAIRGGLGSAVMGSPVMGCRRVAATSAVHYPGLIPGRLLGSAAPVENGGDT